MYLLGWPFALREGVIGLVRGYILDGPVWFYKVFEEDLIDKLNGQAHWIYEYLYARTQYVKRGSWSTYDCVHLQEAIACIFSSECL